MRAISCLSIRLVTVLVCVNCLINDATNADNVTVYNCNQGPCVRGCVKSELTSQEAAAVDSWDVVCECEAKFTGSRCQYLDVHSAILHLDQQTAHLTWMDGSAVNLTQFYKVTSDSSNHTAFTEIIDSVLDDRIVFTDLKGAGVINNVCVVHDHVLNDTIRVIHETRSSDHCLKIVTDCTWCVLDWYIWSLLAVICILGAVVLLFKLIQCDDSFENKHDDEKANHEKGMTELRKVLNTNSGAAKDSSLPTIETISKSSKKTKPTEQTNLAGQTNLAITLEDET